VSTDVGAAPLAGLEKARAQLERSSTAELVAEILREWIQEGRFRPGERLKEEAIGDALNVSRNTLRESFRLLTHERVLVHELNRGVFVRMLKQEDVTGLYRVRKILECAAIRELASAPPGSLADVAQAVEAGEHAAEEGRWHDVGTANIRFHQSLVALAGSPRIDEFMARILAELRLAFYVMKNRRHFHEPYLARNRELLGVLEAGDFAAAESLLEVYLNDAEQQLTRAYARALRRG
jgi:DNA-binding GntR family transcriptional regulator